MVSQRKRKIYDFLCAITPIYLAPLNNYYFLNFSLQLNTQIYYLLIIYKSSLFLFFLMEHSWTN